MAESNIKNNVVDDVRASYLREFESKIVKLNLQSDLFATIVFPNLPYNFELMMADIDWPEKAKKNPNGTLFTSPQDIDESDADDIGLQCFNSDKFNNDLVGLKMTMNQKAYESQTYELSDSLLMSLYEDSANMEGKSIDVRSIKKMNMNRARQNANVAQAISTYVTRSIEVIKPLVEMVAGDNASTAVKQVAKIIHTANQVAVDNVEDWLKAQNSVEKTKDDTKIAQEIKDVKKEKLMAEYASKLFSCLSISDFPNGLDKNKFLIQCAEEMQGVDTENRLKNFITRFTTIGSINNLKNMLERNGDSAFKLREDQIKASGLKESLSSLDTDVYNALFEADDEDGENSHSNDETIDYDKIQEDLFNTLSTAMDEAIGPRENWKVMKDVANQMKKLKEDADKCISERIKLVCKTGGQKSIFTHPKVANGLENMWSRYSAELQNRIDNRIAQLTGSNGGRASGSASMVEDFLRTTYPQILSVLLTYRCVFVQIANQYKNGYIPSYTLEEVEPILQAADDRYTARLMVVLRTFDTINS